jgi:nitrite reductase (NO-forming)
VPGEYAMVDHSIFRAFNKGAVGQIVVDGAPAPALYADHTKETLYGGATAGATGEPSAPATAEDRMAAGARVYAQTCAACHQLTGRGLPRAFPPLAGSDFLMADKERAVGIVLGGLKGKVTVNGETIDGIMPPQSHLSDDDLANALTFVRNSWGNSGQPVTREEVAKRRKEMATFASASR